ncbi:hypothetical protein Dsin_022319 [Dipteronia sinensis]|uniref:RNase H type-1 domain-containing protein n=1 Tax=Dipteronia sinensis TaxID=43782 RepID=A0AAE0A1D0_9ROSI|nr:hypothetical protein Dsin_022319 [Dipteronia sinensis]
MKLHSEYPMTSKVCGIQAFENVYGWSVDYLASFRAANTMEDCSRSNGDPVVVRWQPLGMGYYKINSNATVDCGSATVGVGLTIHDCEGFVMAVSAQRIQANYSPQVAEAVALLHGIILAADAGLSSIVVESDALGVS